MLIRLQEIVFNNAMRVQLGFQRYGNVSEDEERPSLPDDIYCGLIETLNEKCFVTSLLEMWR